MKRKQNIFLFLENSENSEAAATHRTCIALSLVRLYVNKYIIGENDQCEIQAVIPLNGRTSKCPYCTIECPYMAKRDPDIPKVISDCHAILGQLHQLRYKYFIEESYITHFICTSVDYSTNPGVGAWIEYWFNKNAAVYQESNADYRFVFTSLEGLTGKLCNKQEVKDAYKKPHSMDCFGKELKWLDERDPHWNGNSLLTWRIPVDTDIEVLKQTITADQMRLPSEKGFSNLRSNLNTSADITELFYYKQLTDFGINKLLSYYMNEESFWFQFLLLSEKSGVRPNYDKLFLRNSGRRYSVVINPKPLCWSQTKQRFSKSTQLYDQSLKKLETMAPIRKPSRWETAYYDLKQDTIPVLDHIDLFHKYLE